MFEDDEVSCPMCDSTGYEECPECGGDGDCAHCGAGSCPECGGKGRVDCNECDGHKLVPRETV